MYYNLFNLDAFRERNLTCFLNQEKNKNKKTHLNLSKFCNLKPLEPQTNHFVCAITIINETP